MANWNSGYYYNKKGNEQGFVWNSDTYLIILNLHEIFQVDETISEQLAGYLLIEKINKFYDELLLQALYDTTPERFSIKEEPKVFQMFFLTEQLGIKDEFTDLLVLAFLHDQMNIVEQARIFAEILTTDKINIKDITTIEAFYEMLDTFKLFDLKASMQAMINVHDRIAATDHEPRTAVSDFLIGAIDNLDRAFDWLIPFGLKIDWGKSKIDVMPEAELTKIQIPGIDGSIIEDSVYKDRLFEIVAFSEQGLTIYQKEEIKKKITRVLDATKHRDKKLTVQANSVSFDVRYEGQAEIVDGPSYVKATIPLTSGPYGYDMFDNELFGPGLVINNGDAPLKVKHTITGAINNPRFSLGTINYIYNGNLGTQDTLVIDHELMTCYLINNLDGKKTNVLNNLQGEFQAIPIGESVVLNATAPTSNQITTTWTNKLIW